MSELKKLDISFEAPGRTLFLLDSSELRLIPFYGNETSIPTRDFLDLLLHLVLHQAAALVILKLPSGLLGRVLTGITALTDEEDG